MSQPAYPLETITPGSRAVKWVCDSKVCPKDRKKPPGQKAREEAGTVGLPWWLSSEDRAWQCRRCGFSPRVGKIPWRRNWLPTPIYLPEKSHGQRSLAGYSPWGHKQSDTAEQLSHHQCGLDSYLNETTCPKWSHFC